ncbi:MAG: hypothetical protein WCW35_11700 [Bacteroidota bacterium]|jgi:hypothetical protein
MKKIVVLILVFNAIIFGQELQFLKEDITFQISEDVLRVDGYYWFSNASLTASDRLIFFPFGSSELRSSVYSIGVWNISLLQSSIHPQKYRDGISFVLSIPALDTTVIRISYRQRIIGDSVTYILRSTIRWGRALESAEYKLRVDPHRRMTAFSITPDRMYTVGEEVIYFWKRVDFMPHSDLTFYFRKQ